MGDGGGDWGGKAGGKETEGSEGFFFVFFSISFPNDVNGPDSMGEATSGDAAPWPDRERRDGSCKPQKPSDSCDSFLQRKRVSLGWIQILGAGVPSTSEPYWTR